MQRGLIRVLECSRVFSLPMTIFSWLIIFVYSLIDSGNIFYGLLTLVGLSFAHLGTNLIDDYFDYKSLIKQVGFDKIEYLKNSQKTKCRYIISGLMSENRVLMISLTYFGIAMIIGLFLYMKCGIGILYFMLAGGLIAIFYPFVSRICLSEVAIALAFGPLLFGGVYYAMTGVFNLNSLFLSIPSMFVTIILLYVHTVMDFEFDLNEGKRTLSNLFNSRLESLIILKILIFFVYLAIIVLCVFDICDWQIFLTFLTIPLAIDLYKSMEIFSCDPEEKPEHRWFHHPMENIVNFEKRGEASFMIRMFQARNLMIYFSVFMIIGIVLSLAL